MKNNLRRLVFAGGGYPFATLVVLAAAALLFPLRSTFEAPAIMLAFVPVIIGLARVFGVGVSTMSAILAFFALDFLYLPPYYGLFVGTLPEWLGLLTFLVVALVAGQQTSILRRREQAALHRQQELEFLNVLSSRILSAATVDEIAQFAVEQAEEVLGLQRVSIYLPGGATEPAICIASAGSPAPSSGEEARAAWAIRHARTLDARSRLEGEAEFEPSDEAVGWYIPLTTAQTIEGVLHVMPHPAEKGGDQPDPALFQSVGNLVAASLERQRLGKEAARAESLREADRLRSTFISSISHELKTPLAAATARVTGLLEEPGSEPERLHAELGEVSEDLVRLNESIADLLDLARLESNAWRPKLEMRELSEILGTVLAHLPVAQRQRIHFSLASDAAEICCDFAQIARVLTIVVENALSYSPPQSPVHVSSRQERGNVLVAVEDAGPGVPNAEKALVFDKFYRGSALSNIPGGTGLGLAIAREIVATHQGRVWVEDAEPKGARFVIELPGGSCEGRVADGGA